MKASIQAIVLAAGKSTRFNTQTTKLLHKICGQEMILYPLKLLEKFTIPTTLIVGHQAEDTKYSISQNTQQPKQYIEQTYQGGTGHALICSKSAWNKDHILVMNGDMPLVNETTLTELFDKHFQTNADLSFVTSHNTDPAQQYGRVIEENGTIRIIEARHLKNLHDYCCINAGIYLFKKSFLEEVISLLVTNAESNECYITDLIGIASDKKYNVQTVTAPFDTVRGVNTMKELWAVEHIKRSDLISFWMSQGVRFNSAHTVHIDINVTIGAGTNIGNSVQLFNGTTIGKDCLIDSFSTLEHVQLGNNVHIKQNSLLYNSCVGNNSLVGPFAHIQENTDIHENSVIGNFVEIKRATIGNNTKIKHLTYIADATIGNNVNIGAGTITCNYDGKIKQKTIIKNNVFIGSNNTLIAPLIIEEGSYTAGGSVITDNVPAHSLAIGRAHQVIKPDYVKKKENNSFLAASKADHHLISHDT